jgi:hypothetical protein
MNSAQLLSLVRDLYSRRPEAFYLEPHELAWLLFALRYTDALEGRPKERSRWEDYVAARQRADSAGGLLGAAFGLTPPPRPPDLRGGTYRQRGLA